MITTKIKNIKKLRPIINRLKSKNKKIGFTNGCFDILHFGHVKYLQQAKKSCDVLIVGINTDNSVKKIKGKKRPIVGQKDRAAIVAALESVDYVTLFSESTPLNFIREIRPDIIIKGADWKSKDIVGSGFVSSYGGKVVTIPFVNNRSSSNIIKKIAKRF